MFNWISIGTVNQSKWQTFSGSGGVSQSASNSFSIVANQNGYVITQ